MATYDASVNTNNSVRSNRTYSDLNLNFNKNPATKDVAKLKDVEAVKRAVRNLILTNRFERPFHPEIGSDVRAMLFEPMTPLTALNLQRKVAEVLTNFEPRINLQQVLASPDLDRNSYALKILFYVVGSNQPVEVETFLERLR